MVKTEQPVVYDQDKVIAEWVAEKNSHIGEITVPRVAEYPVDFNNWYGATMNEWITTDLIRHYVDAIGDRNPLFRFEEYARGTRWGGIIAPPGFPNALLHCYGYRVDRDDIKKKFTKGLMRNPGGIKIESLRLIRPGDHIRVVKRYLGVKEVPSTREEGSRCFLETMRRSLINQREELVANYDTVLKVFINSVFDDKHPAHPGRKRYRLTDEQRDAIERGYDEEKFRGGNTLFWEDVSAGDTFKLHDIGPHAVYDSVAYCVGGMSGHTVAYDVEHERVKGRRPWHWLDPEVNAYTCSGICHFCDNKGHTGQWTGGLAVGFWPQSAGLMGRLLSSWMGDDGFVKRLDVDYPSNVIVGDVLRHTGKVTKKYIDKGEHVVDVEAECRNAHDNFFLTHMTGTVRLASRTDTQG